MTTQLATTMNAEQESAESVQVTLVENGGTIDVSIEGHVDSVQTLWQVIRGALSHLFGNFVLIKYAALPVQYHFLALYDPATNNVIFDSLQCFRDPLTELRKTGVLTLTRCPCNDNFFRPARNRSKRNRIQFPSGAESATSEQGHTGQDPV